MSLYEKIRDFKNKILVPVGLAIILNSCSNAPQTTSIFKDLDGDTKPEYIYMVYTGETGKWKDIPTYELKMKKGLGKGLFGKEILIQKFAGKPTEIRFEDITGDRIPDLSYIICTGTKGWKETPIFELRMRKGLGDGTFEQPKVIQKYEGNRTSFR
jgi:hypothetical protein